MGQTQWVLCLCLGHGSLRITLFSLHLDTVIQNSHKTVLECKIIVIIYGVESNVLPSNPFPDNFQDYLTQADLLESKWR